MCIYRYIKYCMFLLFSALLFSNTFGQKWTQETHCSTDTVIVEVPEYFTNKGLYAPDYPYKAVLCETRSMIGFRLDIGISNYYYGENTTEWIGRHGGPCFGFVLAIAKANVGLRFKPWTVSPKKELAFQGVVLPTYAKLNPVKVDYFLGYSFDFNFLLSLEPYIGYNSSSFHVINEDELQQTYSISKTGGFITGVTLNKYFQLKDYSYISVFGSAGYGFVDYSKVHPDLDYGYFEWTLGIALKGYLVKRFKKRVGEVTKTYNL